MGPCRKYPAGRGLWIALEIARWIQRHERRGRMWLPVETSCVQGVDRSAHAQTAKALALWMAVGCTWTSAAMRPPVACARRGTSSTAFQDEAEPHRRVDPSGVLCVHLSPSDLRSRLGQVGATYWCEAVPTRTRWVWLFRLRENKTHDIYLGRRGIC